MQLVIRAVLFLPVRCFFYLNWAPLPSSLRPVKGGVCAPGEEEMSGDAAELYQIGQSAEKKANLNVRSGLTRRSLRRHPKDALASTALYRAAQLQEQNPPMTPAADSYLQLVESIRAARILMRRSRGNFGLVRFI
jgi:hypothetical protein